MLYVSQRTSQICPVSRTRNRYCCASGNQQLAIAGASLMVGFALFQLLAFILMIVIEKDIDDGEWGREGACG